MCGDEFVITNIIGGKYIGHPDSVSSISIDMIEPAPEIEIDGAEIDDFLNGIKVN